MLEPADEEGRESIVSSSRSVVLGGAMSAYEEDGLDIVDER